MRKRKDQPRNSIQCPKCKRVSFNLCDVEYKYCVTCGWHSDILKKNEARKGFIKNRLC